MTSLAWLLVLSGLVSLDARMIGPVLPAIADTLQVSAGQAGLGLTAYTLSYGVMQVVYGPLSDRYGRVRVIRTTAALFAVGTALSGLAAGPGGFVAARFLTGMVAAATIPTTFAYIGDNVPYESRQPVIARMAIVISGAQALSATLAGTVTHLVSWRLLFVAYAVLTMATLLVMRGAPEVRASAPPRVRYVELLAMPRALAVYVAAAVEGFFFWGGTGYLAVLARERLGWNDLQVALLVALFGVGTIVGGLMLARLAAAVGERRLTSGGGLVEGLGFGALVLPLPWPLFALALLAIGLGFAGLHSTLQTRGTELLPAARGKAFSLFALGYFVGGAAGTAAVGWLVDAGRIELAMAGCAAGLIAVGQYAARRSEISPRTGA